MPKKRSDGPKWEDPPPRRRTTEATQNHKEVADLLKTRPGTWRYILSYSAATTAGSVAQSIRTGHTSAWAPAGSFDAVARTVDGQHRVYARYIGGTE